MVRTYGSVGVAFVVVAVAALATMAPGNAISPSQSAVDQKTVTFALIADRSSEKLWRYVDLGWPAPPPSAGFHVDRSRGPVKVTLRATMRGATARLRLLDSGRVIKPVRSFTPGANHHNTVFTFLDTKPVGVCGHVFRVGWRSPTGRLITIRRGELAVTYTASGQPGVACL
jgi:hypothetical protein